MAGRLLPLLRQSNNYSISVEVARIVCYSVSRPLTARYARMTWDWNGDGGKTHQLHLGEEEGVVSLAIVILDGSESGVQYY